MRRTAVAQFVLVSCCLAQTASDYQAARDAGQAALDGKDYVTAERELRKALELEPSAGQVSYRPGIAIPGQRKSLRLSEALYHLARAVVIVEGTDGLSADDRRAADAYLKRVYDAFHGSDDGLDRLKELASQSAFPPPDFRI